MVEGGPGGRLCPIRLPYYDTTLCTTSIFHGEQTSFVGSLGPQNCRTLFFDLHLFYHLFKKCHPKAWVPPFLLDFSFYLLPFLERIKCFFIQRANASLLGSGKPRGVAKSEDSDPRWGRGLRSITAPPHTCNLRSVSTYPKYDIEAKNEVFDATTDFRTLVVLPGHPLGS
jgi:hypothetical protein